MSTELMSLAETITTGVRDDAQLNLSTDLRNLLSKEIISNGDIATNPQMANVLLAALKANDTVVLTQKRMVNDKEIGAENDAAVIAASLILKDKYGHNMSPDEEYPEIPVDRGDVDGSAFTFDPGESIIGMDTTDAINGG